MTEEWRAVDGYRGLYDVSNHGRIRSYDRIVRTKDRCGSWTTRKMNGKILSTPPNNQGKGYPYCNLVKNGKRVSVTVHRLVALTYVPNPDDKPEVNHKDGNPRNNHFSNLEWVTHKENMVHASISGLLPEGMSGPGEKSPAAKLTDDDVRRIKRRLHIGESCKIIAKDFIVGESAIREIKMRRSWVHV